MINFKKVKLWREYFYRFEKSNNESLLELFDKKIKRCEDNINRDKNIIEKLSIFIANKCQIEDLKELNKDCQKLIEKAIKENKIEKKISNCNSISNEGK